MVAALTRQPSFLPKESFTSVTSPLSLSLSLSFSVPQFGTAEAVCSPRNVGITPPPTTTTTTTMSTTFLSDCGPETNGTPPRRVAHSRVVPPRRRNNFWNSLIVVSRKYPLAKWNPALSPALFLPDAGGNVGGARSAPWLRSSVPPPSPPPVVN